MNRSVPPSPGDKARHLMFQPRRSSRTGAPRWFPPDGDQASPAEAAGDAAGVGVDGTPADTEVLAVVRPDGGYAELGWDDDGDAHVEVSDGPRADVDTVGVRPDEEGATAVSTTGVSTTAVSTTAAVDEASTSADAPAAVIRAASVKSPAAAASGVKTTTAQAAGDVATVLVAHTQVVSELARRVEELARLRRHDADLVDRLHAENSRLRQGELTEALSPLLRGLIRIHDQMASLGSEDADSVAGILKSQLLQVLDLTVDVRPFDVPPGTPFDPARHVGVRGVSTDDPELDRTTVRTVKPGFVRGDSAVVRPAETEVYRAD